MAIGNVTNVNLVVKDANQASQNIRTNQFASDSSLGGISIICDPASGYGATVMAFHNADNQAPGATAYGLLTGGVAQLVNVAGNIDRQKEAGLDNVPALGIAISADMRAMPFQVGTSTAVAAPGAATITLTGATMLKGTNHGVPWQIQVGQVLIYDVGGANQEAIVITAVTPATPSITATFAKTHGASVIVTGFTFNHARDASGECDGASGSGAAVAMGYAFNGGGPGPGNNLDRARSINAKGIATATLSGYSGGTGQSSITLSGGPPTGGPASLQPRMMILLYGAAGINGTTSQVEIAYVGLNYVPGSTTVPILAGSPGTPGTVNAYAYTTIAWDSFVAQGPKTNGFLPHGMGVSCDALFNSVDGKMYLSRMAPGAIGSMAVNTEGSKATYRAAVSAVTPAATPSDIFQLVPGAANPVRIKHVRLTGYAATTAGIMPYRMERRSAANTGGKEVAITIAKQDSGDPGSNTTSVSNYSSAAGNGTPGAVVAVLGAGRMLFPSATVFGPPTVEEQFAARNDKALIFRGTTDIFAITLCGAAVPTGGVYDLEVEWEEDLS